MRRRIAKPRAASATARIARNDAESVGIEEFETTTVESVLLSGLSSGVVDVTVAVFRIEPAGATTVV